MQQDTGKIETKKKNNKWVYRFRDMSNPVASGVWWYVVVWLPMKVCLHIKHGRCTKKKKKRWNEMEWFEGLDREIAVVEFHGVKPTMDAQRLQ